MITLVLGIIAAVNPGWPPDLGQQVRAEMQTAAVRLGLQLVFVPAGTPAVFPGAFAAMAQDRAQALVVPSDFLFAGAANGPVIADSRSGTRLPGIYGERQWVTAGGLMAYSTNGEAIWRGTASYVDRILKGAKPADLPVEQPTKSVGADAGWRRSLLPRTGYRHSSRLCARQLR